MNEELQKQVAEAISAMVKGSPAAWQELCNQAQRSLEIGFYWTIGVSCVALLVFLVMLLWGLWVNREDTSETGQICAFFSGALLIATLAIGGTACITQAKDMAAPALYVLDRVR